jgi:hypothetical protein
VDDDEPEVGGGFMELAEAALGIAEAGSTPVGLIISQNSEGI